MGAPAKSMAWGRCQVCQVAEPRLSYRLRVAHDPLYGGSSEKGMEEERTRPVLWCQGGFARFNLAGA